MIKVCVLVWVGVPIITVKLYDQITRWHKSVYTKLVLNKVLFVIWYTNFIEERITNYLYTGRRVLSLLVNIHFQKPFAHFWVFIAARDGTILYIILLGARWRPPKPFAAYLTNMRCFISALPFNLATQRAKVVFSFPDATSLNINFFSALPTRKHRAFFPACITALLRAKSFASARRWLKRFRALFAFFLGKSGSDPLTPLGAKFTPTFSASAWRVFPGKRVIALLAYLSDFRHVYILPQLTQWSELNGC
jgi:hypothetical protein